MTARTTRAWARLAGAGAVLATLLVAGGAAAEPLSYPGDKGYSWVVTAYYDEGGTTDWNCGGNTYSGHKGTDFAIIGSWQAMAEGRPVLAAAAGTVEATHDGEPDMCMTGNCGGGGGWGNHIRISHADGTNTLYAHLKTWSVDVSVGQEVACGQQIGLVGSSGNSTGPHLHFEKRTTANYADVTDPFAGPCSPGPGYWIDQGVYNGLPGDSCPDVILPWPVLSLGISVDPIDGQEPDFNPDGASQGIFDAYVGQDIVVNYTVTNSVDDSAVAQNVRAGFELSGHWSVGDWIILDNWPQNSCGGDWCPNDSNDKPENLPPDQLGGAFSLELGQLSPGESKRVVLTLAAATETAPDEHARAAYYVAHVDNVYEKGSYDAGPNNVDGKQTWNGGDLKLLFEADLYPDPDPNPGTTGGPMTSGDPSDSATWTGGGTDPWTTGASATASGSDSGTTGGTSGSGSGGSLTGVSAGASDGSGTDTGGGGALPDDYGADARGDLSGCACAATRGPSAPTWPWGLFAAGLLVVRRRRRA